jgi:hypothetical protein
MKPEDTSNLIAGIALGVSALALIVSGLMFWWQNRLQSRVAAIEEARRREEVEARQRAHVTVGITRASNLRGDLVLANEGPAVARSVTIEISSASEAKPPQVLGLERLPVHLQPGQPMSFDLLGSLAEAGPINALVRWVDDAGPHEATFTLRTFS